MTAYLAIFCKFGHYYTSYVESKPLAVATHSKGFEWLDHMLHPTKDYTNCTFYADTMYIYIYITNGTTVSRNIFICKKIYWYIVILYNYDIYFK